MRFVSTKTAHRHRPLPEPMLKAWEDTVDDDLLLQIEALAAAFRNAISGMSAAIREARRGLEEQGGLQGLDPREFERLFTQEVVNAIRVSLPSVSDELMSEVIRSAEQAYRDLPAGISVRYRFNAKDARAVSWAENRAGGMIVQIGQETLASVRQIIARALARGGGVDLAAREISRVVGLHDRWQRAVENFYGREVARLSPLVGPDVAILRAQEAALAYHDRLVRARALNIARTEILAAQNIGQVLSWYQAADAGALDIATAEKEWVVGPDGWRGIDVCDECMELAGQRVPMGSVFSNGEFMPPLHPNCRCTLNLIPMADFVEEEFAPLSMELEE